MTDYINLGECSKCTNYKNFHFCLVCKLFYSNNPTYFENLYKEKEKCQTNI